MPDFYLILILVFVLVNTTEIQSVHVVVSILYFLLIVSLYYAKKKKISKMWALDILIDIILCISLIFLFHVFVNVVHEKTLALRDQFRDAPVTVPDEHIFDGMKKYTLSEVKLSEDKMFATDMEGKPITGVVILADEPTKKVMIAFKNGYHEGYNLSQYNHDDDNHIFLVDFKKSEKANIRLFQEFWNNQLIYEYKNNGEYIYGRRYNDAGKLIWDAITNINLEMTIIRGHNKNGIKTVEIDTFINSDICFLKDGTKRNATQEEVKRFSVERKKSAATSFSIEDVTVEPDYEFDFSCSE